jgi:hypothetical protein
MARPHIGLPEQAIKERPRAAHPRHELRVVFVGRARVRVDQDPGEQVRVEWDVG